MYRMAFSSLHQPILGDASMPLTKWLTIVAKSTFTNTVPIVQ